MERFYGNAQPEKPTTFVLKKPVQFPGDGRAGNGAVVSSFSSSASGLLTPASPFALDPPVNL